MLTEKCFNIKIIINNNNNLLVPIRYRMNFTTRFLNVIHCRTNISICLSVTKPNMLHMTTVITGRGWAISQFFLNENVDYPLNFPMRVPLIAYIYDYNIQ